MIVLKNKFFVFLLIIFLILSCFPPVYAEDGETTSGETASDTQSSVSSDSSGESSETQSDSGLTDTNDMSQSQTEDTTQNPVVNEVVDINPIINESVQINPEPVIETQVPIVTDETSGESQENPVVEVVLDISDTSTSPINLSEVEAKAEDGNDIVSEIIEIQGEEKNVEYLENEVLNVVVPISISVTIDPLELEGKGQIYSKDYRIQNKGDSEVLLKFEDIKLVFPDETNFKTVDKPFNNTFFRGLKTIYMELGFGTRDIPPAVITSNDEAKQITIPLSNSEDMEDENAHLQFNFSGCVNEAPELAWQDNDVMVNINYSLHTVSINDIVEPEEPMDVEQNSAISDKTPLENDQPNFGQQPPTLANENQTSTAEGENTSTNEGTTQKETDITDGNVKSDDKTDLNTSSQPSEANEESSSPPDGGSEAESSSSPPAGTSDSNTSDTSGGDSTPTTSSESSQQSEGSAGETSAE